MLSAEDGQALQYVWIQPQYLSFVESEDPLRGMKRLTGHEDDRPSAGGGTERFTSVIKNATNPDSTVYDTNRVGGAFQYGFTPAQGIKPYTSYTVLLYTADLYWAKPGQRTFTVSANGVPVLTDYDVIAEAGKTVLICDALFYGLFLRANRHKWMLKFLSLLCVGMGCLLHVPYKLKCIKRTRLSPQSRQALCCMRRRPIDGSNGCVQSDSRQPGRHHAHLGGDQGPGHCRWYRALSGRARPTLCPKSR